MADYRIYFESDISSTKTFSELTGLVPSGINIVTGFIMPNYQLSGIHDRDKLNKAYQHQYYTLTNTGFTDRVFI